MKRFLRNAIAWGVVFSALSCGARLTIDNKTGAESASRMTWDVAVKISGADFGTIPSGSVAGPHNIGNQWKTEVFNIISVKQNGEEMIGNDAWKAVAQNIAEELTEKVSGYIDSGSYTWYIGLGNTDGIQAVTE